MFRKFLLALGALVASGGVACAAPLEAYGKLPAIEEVQMSPSGSLIAYVVTNGEQRQILIQATADRKVKYALMAGTQKVRDLRWASDDHLIVTSSTTRQPFDVQGPRSEYFLAQDVNLKAGHPRSLLENLQQQSPYLPTHVTLNAIVGLPQVRRIDGKPVVFVRSWNFVGEKGQLALFRVDLDRNEDVMVDEGGGGAYDWLVNAQGEPIAKAYYRDDPGTWKLMVHPPHGDWRVAETQQAAIETPEIAGMGRSENSVLVEDADDKGAAVWRELSVGTGAWSETAAAADGQHAIHDPDTGRLIGEATLVGDTSAYTFFDNHDAAVWRAVIKAYDGDLVTLVSWSVDRKKIIVRVDSAEFGPAFALVDMTTGHADWLGDEYGGLKPEDISPVKPVRYKAADGLDISGYLTLPHGKDPHGLPPIVLPHGGPAARDTPGFGWWAQALASRGYAVLQPNYRGSDGLGPAFLAAGFGEFGRKMQTDLSDAVRDLARQGVIDPKRVCIVGGSYGGYAALAGAALDRGVYRCAVSYAGPSDLRAMISDSREKGGRNALRYWERYIGAKDLRDPVLAKASPASHAAGVDIPVLLIHGKDDTVVPISQSREMAAALRAAGKPVELIELPGEDHWLSSGETRLQMLKASVAFLEKNNPPN